MSSELLGHPLSFLDDVHALGVEKNQPVLQIGYAGGACSGAVVERTQIGNVQFHGDHLGFAFFVGASDVTQAARAGSPIIDFPLRSKFYAATGKEDAAKEFTVVIAEQAGVPRAGSFD